MTVLRMMFLFACVVVGAGCGPGVATAPIKGKVLLDSKPLPKGTIRFESAGNRAATGKIVDGEIVEVTTYSPGDGAPIAKHMIAVWATEEASNDPGKANYMAGKSLIDTSYNNPKLSGLEATINSGQNVIELKLVTKRK
jgi:hypothetical protein